MMPGLRRIGWGGCAAVVALGLSAARAGEWEAYWWQDELREVAFSLSRARTGAVSSWPRLCVRGGGGTVPLPRARGTVTLDGRLDDPAWSSATSFPVGPLFGPWHEGPFRIEVRACRDGRQLYLALRSPRDLSELEALGSPGALFTAAGRPFAVGAPEVAPGSAVGRDGVAHVVELAVPIPEGDAPLELRFHVELVRRPGGSLPDGFAEVGLSRLGQPPGRTVRRDSLWIEPVEIRLVPAGHAARVRPDAPARSPEGVSGGERADGGVSLWRWRSARDGAVFQLEGFRYVEPVREAIERIRRIASRCVAAGGGSNDLVGEAERLAAEIVTVDPRDRRALRTLYCALRSLRASVHLRLLDAPLLFVKRHPYYAGHIYDDYYTWSPGGGVYVLEDPSGRRGRRRVRAVIDPETTPTLGGGVYRDAELSWDARRVLFSYKAGPAAATSIYEVDVRGGGLRRVTSSESHHDITPCYLPDGRIVFTSTRPRGRVPCFNSGVDTLHTMRPDGTGVRSISSNNVNEFDPAVLPDGRILYGRWEYVDKTALYMQSLWTVFPDGTNETALFANNLAKPTAILDARPVPGTQLVIASLTPHNGQAVGAIGLIDPLLGKNAPEAITSFTPEYPTAMDQGLHVGPCDPWPLSSEDVLVSNNAIGGHGVLELIDRDGNRELVHADRRLSCFSPALVKPRPAPPVLAGDRPGPGGARADEAAPGRFLVLDVYRGLSGVRRGEIRWLRLTEETARTSEVPPGGRWWNQAFLTSWQGAYVVKNILGLVEVHADGSAYFEAPPGRALYLHALDADGREVQRMRTFVQAVPGVTRSCVGCHEPAMATPASRASFPQALESPPARPLPETWGSGFIDYPTMVQPVLDRRCVRCHGGEEGISAGVDLSGGWTWAFNISYETLLKRNLVGFLRCHNSDVTTSEILPPRTIGSGAAALGDLLAGGHREHAGDLTRAERDLVMAWMDTNSNYHGTWDYTEHATVGAILATGQALAEEMERSGCTRCHPPGHIGNDWVNLQRPEWSRILRAPLARDGRGLGLAWCRDRKAPAGLPLVTQRHMPPDVFHPPRMPARDPAGEPHVTFASDRDPRYRAMLDVIRSGRSQALASPRVDMPGAEVVHGTCRMQARLPLPKRPPPLDAAVDRDGRVLLTWPRTAETIGLRCEVHRSEESGFLLSETTRIGETAGFSFADELPPVGEQHYAAVFCSDGERGPPSRVKVRVPELEPPEPPRDVTATAEPGQVALSWSSPGGSRWRFHVYRSGADAEEFQRLSADPVRGTRFEDFDVKPGVEHHYLVRAVNRRGTESAPSRKASAAALAEEREPVFRADLLGRARGTLDGGRPLEATVHGAALLSEDGLDLGDGGHVTFPHREAFDVGRRLSVTCAVFLEEPGEMPVVLSCGQWRGSGWFLQRYGGGWRWHVGGVDCDGGSARVGRWIRLAGVFDGRSARLFVDGEEVRSVPCRPDRSRWPGALFVGQYGAAPGPPYQVRGRIRNVRIYRRALRPEDLVIPPAAPR